MRSRHINNGFTLIELLVVISIIALLISILLPSLSAAREQAKSSACRSNLRQIGIAFASYMADNEGVSPTGWARYNVPGGEARTQVNGWAPAWNVAYPWQMYIWQHAGANMDLFVDPVWDKEAFIAALESREGALDIGADGESAVPFFWSNYGMHRWMGSPTLGRETDNGRIEDSSAPSNQVLAGDAGSYYAMGFAGDIHSSASISYIPGENTIAPGGGLPHPFGTPALAMGDINHGRHPGPSINLLYLDSHVSTAMVSELLKTNGAEATPTDHNYWKNTFDE